MTKNLAILAVLAFALGLLVLLVNTLFFIRATLPEAAFPVAEFDANVPRQVQIDDADYDYLVHALVPQRGDPAPTATLSITDANGNPIPTAPTNGYADLMGRHYTSLAKFSVDSAGPITVTVESGPLEDFAVFRDIQGVLSRHYAGATPGWVAGFILLALAIGLLVAAMLKSEKGLDRQISGTAR